MDGGLSDVDTEASRAARRSKWERKVQQEGTPPPNGDNGASAGGDHLDSLLAKDYGDARGGETPALSGVLRVAPTNGAGSAAAGAVAPNKARTHSPSGRKLSTRERSKENRRLQLAGEGVGPDAPGPGPAAPAQTFADGSSMRGSVRSATVPEAPAGPSGGGGGGGSGLPPTARWGSPPPRTDGGDVSERVAAAAGAGGTVSEGGGSDSSEFSAGDPLVSPEEPAFDRHCSFVFLRRGRMEWFGRAAT